MVTSEVFMDILSYHRQGFSMRWIAKKLGVHRNTVKRYITEKAPPSYRKKKRRESILAPYHHIIRD
jgi:transposase